MTAFVFSVEKDLTEKTISVTIHSTSLLSTITDALQSQRISYQRSPGGFYPIHNSIFPVLVENYEALKGHRINLEAHRQSQFTTREFSLLVDDFLLDRAVFEGIDLQQRSSALGCSNPLTPGHVHDIRQRIFDAGLDEIDDCFAMGSMPDAAEDDYILAMNDQYARHAYSGEPAKLYRLCEPLVGGGNQESNSSAASFPPEAPENPSLDVYGCLQDPVSRLGLHDGPTGSAVPAQLSVANNMTFGPGRSNEAGSRTSVPQPSFGFEEGAFGHPSIGQDPRGNFSRYPSILTTTGMVSGQNASLALPHSNQSPRRGIHGHFERQQMGQSIISVLESLCLRIRATCEGLSGEVQLDPSFPAQYISLSKVWYRGLTVFRNALNNRPPAELMDSIDCLVVASSICAVIPNNEWMRRQFENDLDSWRSQLDPSDYALFDVLAESLWNYNQDDVKVKKTDLGDWFEFTELLQNIVSTDKVDSHHTLAPYMPFSTRLAAVHSEHARRSVADDGDGRPGPVAIPGNSSGGGRGDDLSTRKRTWEDSFFLTPDSSAGFSMDDFFDVEKFLSQSIDSETPSGANIDADIDFFLKDILRPTAHLLASVAYAVIFTFMIGTFFQALPVIVDSSMLTNLKGLRTGFDNPIMEQWNRAHTFDRSCEIIRTYLSLLGNEDLSPKGDGEGRRLHNPENMAPGANQLNHSAVSMRSGDHRRLAPFPEPSASAPASRFSRPRLHSHSPAPDPDLADGGDGVSGGGGGSNAARPRLLCPQCQRSFSTVSNRNKHIREGCAHRQRDGYRCRHPNCTKVLTTKWYRNTHEQERCKYRTATAATTTSHHGSLT